MKFNKWTLGLAAIAAIGIALIGSGCTFVADKTTQTVTASPTGPMTNTVKVVRHQIWGGYVVEHSSTLFGADVESPSGQNNGTVKFKVGFGNDYTRYTPTSTNPIYAPRYVTSLGVHQGLANSDISGESASGDTFYSNTNGTAGASVPGTPTPQQTK